MTQWLNLSRAARLIGVPRGELQRAIREGRLAANDGLVSTAGLLALYPRLSLEESGAFERVSRVKDEAFGRRVLDRALPGREALAQRLIEQSGELTEARRHLARYHALVVAIEAQIAAAAADLPAPSLAALQDFVARGLAEVLATTAADPLAVMDDLLKIVSAHVTVRPSGREFFVEGRDTLLEAGLKAGLKLNYGCGNGTCGLCKARVIEGEVTRVAHHDYPLSEAERLAGHVLLCVHAAASSQIVLESLEAQGPHDIPVQEVVVRVRSVRPLAPEVVQMHVQTPRTSRLRFLAGQEVTLSVSTAEGEVAGTYPIASCPCDDRNLLFHLLRDDGDALALRAFAGAITPDTPVHLVGPTGDFVLAESERNLVFLACDTGFAPVKSLTEHAMAQESAEQITLGWLATSPDGHYLANLCRAWAAALDHFAYVPCTDADPGQGAVQLVDAVAAQCALAACDAYVSGPAPFVAAAVAALAAHDVPRERIRTAPT